MPKKTLALITGLVLVTIVLFIIALRAGQQQSPVPSQAQPVAQQPTIAVPAHTVLNLGPNPIAVAPGQQGSVQITMDTSDNNVTAVQLELGYDPTVISNVKVTPGTMFTNPIVLINKNNVQTGRYTYAFGITPNSPTVKGTGVVATVTFTTNYNSVGKATQIALLPTTLVTARGVAQSVLKSVNGIVLNVTSSSAPTYNTGVKTGASTNTYSPPAGATGK